MVAATLVAPGHNQVVPLEPEFVVPQDGHDKQDCESMAARRWLLFVDKVRDIVGLYLSPPNRALVLSIDEKSQIQALDREQPVLPKMPGVPEGRTHSYVRHGTTSLFAALDVASGFVIGKCYKRHRAAELLNFLKEVDA
jgi:hypothetical protein